MPPSTVAISVQATPNIKVPNTSIVSHPLKNLTKANGITTRLCDNILMMQI